MTSETTASDVLAFWLGPEADRDAPDQAVSARWWKKDPAFDREIEATFGRAIEEAAQQKLDAWAVEPRGRLAVVILLDQFTRNVYRDSGRMYAGDAHAVALACAGIDAGEDRTLAMAERYFLYMPLMHAEDLALQDRCVSLFEALAEQAPHLSGSVKFAKAHRDIVARFGRFPHRNALLGRTSTDEEIAFLKEPGSSF